MKNLILYRSILGSSKQYALWLNDRIQADLFKFGKISLDKLNEYDRIIIFSGIYAGQVSVIGYLNKNWEKFQNKKIIVVAVGVISEDTPEGKKIYDLIPKKIKENISYFKLPGRFFGMDKDKVQKVELDKIIELLDK